MSDPIDTGGATGLKDYSLKPGAKKYTLDLDSLSTKELLELRNDIDMRLPTLSLKNFDPQQAALLHYYELRELQKLVSETTDIPTNQKAQVANSLSAALASLTKMRLEIYNSEQFRLMEGALAKALKETPVEFQEAFLALYQKKAEELTDVGPNPPA